MNKIEVVYTNVFGTWMWRPMDDVQRGALTSLIGKVHLNDLDLQSLERLGVEVVRNNPYESKGMQTPKEVK